MANEEAAFRTEGPGLAKIMDFELPESSNSLRAEFNDIPLFMYRDPYGLIRKYLRGYGHQCGV